MLAQQDQTQGGIEVTDDSIIDSIADSGINASTAPSSPSLDVKIPRVPTMVRETDEYEKYYVPKVVSIGPYHFGKPKLQSVEKLKPVFTMKLLENNKETLRSLYNKLGEPQMVQDLRSYYEKDSTTMFCNKEFTKMMLLDGCFVLYYIKYIYFGHDYKEMKGSQINFASQDLFLLENQIPSKVLAEVAQTTKVDLHRLIRPFIHHNSIIAPWAPTLRWAAYYFDIRRQTPKFAHFDHLLQVLRSSITTEKDEDSISNQRASLIDDDNLQSPENFRSASELVDVGIHFEPSHIMSLSSVEFSKGWLRFRANVKLPRIDVNPSTRQMLLNMIAYETCLCSAKDAHVTLYVCLLDSLIDHAEDVKILRKSWVLETSLGSDEEVAKMFNEMATNLAPNNWAYGNTRYHIQAHYESWSNTLFPQLKNEYFKSPWAIFVLLGALLGLLLTAIQTYSSLTSECDDLCKFLKKNHHL